MENLYFFRTLIPDIENESLIAEIEARVNVVVNMKIPDNDLLHSRQAMGYDPLTGKNISPEFEKTIVFHFFF